MWLLTWPIPLIYLHTWLTVFPTWVTPLSLTRLCIFSRLWWLYVSPFISLTHSDSLWVTFSYYRWLWWESLYCDSILLYCRLIIRPSLVVLKSAFWVACNPRLDFLYHTVLESQTLNHPLVSCYVSTGRQPDLGGALSDCHLLSCAGVSPRGLQPILIKDGTLQHVSSETAALQPVRSCKQDTQWWTRAREER